MSYTLRDIDIIYLFIIIIIIISCFIIGNARYIYYVFMHETCAWLGNEWSFTC